MLTDWLPCLWKVTLHFSKTARWRDACDSFSGRRAAAKRKCAMRSVTSAALASPRSALVQKHTICPIFWLGALLFFYLFVLQLEEVCLCVQAANKGSTMSSICRPSTPTGTLFVSGTLNNNNSNNSRTSSGGMNTLQCVPQFLTT